MSVLEVRRRHRPGRFALGVVRARVELLLFTRQVDTMIFSFLLPVFMLVVFATVFGQRVGDGHGQSVTYAQYFLPGILAAGVCLVSFQTIAITVALERFDGTLKRLAASPLPCTCYFAGKCVSVLAAAVAQTALLLGVASIGYGVPLPGDVTRWVTFGWVFIAATTAGVLLGVAYSAVPRSAQAVSPVVAGPVLVLQFVSGVYFSFPDLPRWLQVFASLFPLKWAAQGMRSVFLPDGFAAQEVSGSWQRGGTALVLLGWAVVGLVLCLRTFRWTRDGR